MSFVQKIVRRSTDQVIYCITEHAGGDIDYFSYVLAVPVHKQTQFEAAMTRGPIDLRDHGDILHYSAGLLSDEDVDAVLKKTA